MNEGPTFILVKYAVLSFGLLQGSAVSWGCSGGEKLLPALPREEASTVRAFADVHLIPVAPLPHQPTPLASLTPPLYELQKLTFLMTQAKQKEYLNAVADRSEAICTIFSRPMLAVCAGIIIYENLSRLYASLCGCKLTILFPNSQDPMTKGMAAARAPK